MLIALLALGARPAPIIPRLHVRYEFAVRARVNTPDVLVRTTFTGFADRRVEFAIPSSWAGQDSLRHAITDLTIERPARLVADSGSFLVVDHPAGTPIVLHYRLQQDWAGPIRWPQYHRPIVDSSHVVFNTENGLIYPRVDDATPLDVSVSWTGVPPSWPIVTSLGNTRQVHRRLTDRQLAGSSFVTGRFRIIDRSPAPGQMLILTEGHWSFPDSALGGLLQRVWNSERSFWHDDPFGRGFFVLMPTGQRGSIGGTAFAGGFVEIADSTTSVEQVVHIAAHELIHMWNGQLMASGSPDEMYKWFTEGFTDFYADRYFHQAGGLSDSGLADHINQYLRDYHLSPAAGSTRAQVAAGYWASDAMKDYPYRQGYLFALYLDDRLGDAGSTFTFDSLVLQTYRAARHNGVPFSDSLLLHAISPAWRDSVGGWVESAINRGEPIPLTSQRLLPCYVLRDTPVYRFDLGFDIGASQPDRVVRGVEPDGPASRAGVRNGMTLRGWGWINNDPTHDVTLRIADSGGIDTIRYLPRNESPVQVPQLVRDAGGRCE